MRGSRIHVVAVLALLAPFLACAVGDQSPDVDPGPVTPQSQGDSDSGPTAVQPSGPAQPTPSDDAGATPPASDDAQAPPSEDAGNGTPSEDSGGGTVGTDASSGSAVPTTCAQANTTYGCCVGSEVYYCSSGSSSVTKKACSGGEVCGWEASKGYYYCVASPGGADPSGTYPMACH